MFYYTFDFQKMLTILVVFWLVFRFVRSFLHGRPNLTRALIIWTLFFFVLFLLYRTLEPFVFVPDLQVRAANLRPFHGIMRMIENASIFDDKTTQRIVFINIVGNILIFSPFGFFFPLLEKNLRRFWLVVLMGLLISLTIELTQTLLAARVFDVDDLILNSFGTWLGYAFYWVSAQVGGIGKAYDALAEARRPKALLFTILYLAFSVITALTIFYYDYSAYKLIPKG